MYSSDRINARLQSSRRSVLQAASLAVSAIAMPRLFGEGLAVGEQGAAQTPPILGRLTSPVIFAGDAKVAYRDPAALYHSGWFYLYFTMVRTESDGIAYSYAAWTRSRDLQTWSDVNLLTPRDKNLDFGSPGDVIRFHDRWVLCLQTYPRPQGERYGNRDSRIWTMTSRDLRNWSLPELLKVRGPDVARADMGRMIDPYLFPDKDNPRKWWCFYKQNGISKSWSYDLKDWTYAGHTDAGENPCVIVDRGDYVLFHSPPNGIGIKRSRDLENWRDEQTLMLGQKDWPWAQGRLTAGFVLDLRREPGVKQAIMFFHGSRFPEEDLRGGFDNYASIGIAWSNDLLRWHWPPSLESSEEFLPSHTGRDVYGSSPLLSKLEASTPD